MFNERAIQARCENSRESKVTLRKHRTSLVGNMTVTMTANKCRETRPRRPRSPSISSGDASNCFVCQVKSADFFRGPEFSTTWVLIRPNCIREGYCRIALQYSSLY
jgi:hypothetical protein